MGIDFNDWSKRIASRSDLTGRLTHLTKPASDVDTSKLSFEQINIYAVDNLIKILKDKTIFGSSKRGYIVGDTKAVCFQDAPLYALSQNVEHERQRRNENANEKLRYCGVGLSFIKPFIYHDYGGRPVIYENTLDAKDFLPKTEWWRIVNIKYTPEKQKIWDVVDWTHEREWRVPGDMEFEYNKGFVHIILYNPDCSRYFLKQCPKEILDNIYGLTTLTSVFM